MKPLNRKQKFGIWIGISMAMAIGINPPWVEGGPGGAPGPYAPIYAPPPLQPGHQPWQIDYSRVLLQWAMAAMVTVGMVLSAQDPVSKEENKGKRPQPGAQARGSQAGRVVDSQPAIPTPEPEEEVRRLRFREQAIGDVLIESEDDPDYWDVVAEAKGVVEIRRPGRLQLELRKEGSLDLGVLGRPEMTEISSVDASGSQITDEDVVFIASLKNLQELDLSNTQVTNASLKHVARLKSLEKLWLDETKVTADGLAVLKEMPNLTKVSLAGTEVSDSSIINLKEGSDCEFVFTSKADA
jgi:hypothetical protein